MANQRVSAEPHDAVRLGGSGVALTPPVLFASIEERVPEDPAKQNTTQESESALAVVIDRDALSSVPVIIFLNALARNPPLP